MLQLRGLDVLVCGERDEGLHFLQSMLETEGFRAEATSHISEIIACCWNRRCKVAILKLDRQINAEADLEILRVIRQIDPKVPVVVVGDDENLEKEKKIREEGVFYFLTCPLSIRELRSVVQCALAKFEKEAKE